MLKLRLIFGAIFIVLLAGIFYADRWLAGVDWPRAPWSAPPGTIILAAWLLLIPFAMREMRNLLASDNVKISLRITTLSSMLCIAWPWLIQVARQITDPSSSTHSPPGVFPNDSWLALAGPFNSVKPEYLVPTVLAIALIVAFVYHARHQRIDGAMANAGGTLLAIVYLGVLPSFYLPICISRGPWMVLGVIAMVKAADIGAYAAGRTLGRNKLIPWLSPGKTIEGFIGGLVLAGVAGVLVAILAHIPLWQGAIGGVILGAVGQLGDLVESLLKRDAGVKDSGKVPGFGGILDLLDSPLLAAPIAYWLLKLVTKS